MNLRSHQFGQVAVLELDGRFDTVTAPAIASWLARATESAPARVVVDLASVSFVDSTALSTLVRGLHRAARHGGALHLSGVQRPVYMIFELTRLDQAFALFDSVDSAVAAFSN